MPYQVRLARPAQKQLDSIPQNDYHRIHKDLQSLADTPRPRGCVKLGDNLYRIRCGPYRVIFSILDSEQVVLVSKVARRSDPTRPRKIHRPEPPAV